MTMICIGATKPVPAQSDGAWLPAQMIEPDQLAKMLSGAGKSKPVIVLYIGPSILYRSGHIPTAKYLGPSAQEPALNELKRELQSLHKEGEVVLYCGCCPWEHCPNIRPAFSLARQLGFKNLRILHLPRNFKEDWVDRGFPVSQGQ